MAQSRTRDHVRANGAFAAPQAQEFLDLTLLRARSWVDEHLGTHVELGPDQHGRLVDFKGESHDVHVFTLRAAGASSWPVHLWFEHGIADGAADLTDVVPHTHLLARRPLLKPPGVWSRTPSLSLERAATRLDHRATLDRVLLRRPRVVAPWFSARLTPLVLEQAQARYEELLAATPSEDHLPAPTPLRGPRAVTRALG